MRDAELVSTKQQVEIQPRCVCRSMPAGWELLQSSEGSQRLVVPLLVLYISCMSHLLRARWGLHGGVKILWKTQWGKLRFFRGGLYPA